MQTLTPTLFLCYASADREAASALAAFLEAGAGVRVLFEEGQVGPDQDIVLKVREARMADTVLVLFSRNWLPSPWPRYKWEEALLTEPEREGTRIAFLRLDDCSPPRVLLPQFDVSGLALASLRRLKRWVRKGIFAEPAVHHVDLAEQVEELGVALADRAGLATVGGPMLAREFSRVFQQDFDEILRLECGGRSLAALAGDLASQLGLRLESDVERNLAALRAFCEERRFLLWLEGASEDEVRQLAVQRGSSTLATSEARAEAPPDDESLRDIQYILGHPGEVGDWSELCRLARLGFRLSREQGRLAESLELLQKWYAMAEARDDRRILEEASREMVWILESWDRFEEARKVEYRRITQHDDQMALPLLDLF